MFPTPQSPELASYESCTSSYYTNIRYQCGILAEWLRRKIRNLLGSARAGSNPADVDIRFPFVFFQLDNLLSRKVGTLERLAFIRAYLFFFLYFLSLRTTHRPNFSIRTSLLQRPCIVICVSSVPVVLQRYYFSFIRSYRLRKF